ncbi:MAG: organoarsenical effux MFS transporter ArsJ [Gammaproteobacteria bacterium]|nr:organoarsenical effux MFS transporter ArsJ [Gammaproteobacteria bacterium]
MSRAASAQLKQYAVITGNYWAFTLTDGALRMLVVLYFHQLGYAPLAIASLFLFYEFFGVVTNLIGGWLGARIGLNKTMNIGLFLQVIALFMLTVSADMLTVVYVMFAQALSGIAKDLNKMSAKSSIKMLLPDDAQGRLFKWVAILTGSKNTLKGVGFFLGGLLLTTVGFQGAMFSMALVLFIVWCASLALLQADLGKSKSKAKFKDLLSKSRNLNLLSAARLFLFASRDVWFVIALPVYLSQQFQWDHWWVGSLLAGWIIAYGMVQAVTPKLLNSCIGKKASISKPVEIDNKRLACVWGTILSITPLTIIALMSYSSFTLLSIVIGLMIFGVAFAINSSLHSYLIVSIADRDAVSLDVGFYYMANAAGRLLGTVLSGMMFQLYGLESCLLISSAFILLAVGFTSFMRLSPEPKPPLLQK